MYKDLKQLLVGLKRNKLQKDTGCVLYSVPEDTQSNTTILAVEFRHSFYKIGSVNHLIVRQ